jgi:hypothetical protein
VSLDRLFAQLLDHHDRGISQEEECHEVIEKDADTDQTEVKEESDDSFFKKDKMEKRSSPQSRPLRLRIPRTRWLDTNQPQDKQKDSRFIHEALGHLSMATFKEDLKVVKGHESIANIIEVMPDDRQCVPVASYSYRSSVDDR